MGSIVSLFTDVRPIPPQYQVFINFRGKDIRNGFLGFLVDGLLKEHVNVFVDEHELRGRDLNYLFNRIEESRVAVAIFSKDYTDSSWCLKELAKIKECLNEGSIHVIPIFFQMHTDDVKRLKGRFGDNFKMLQSTHCGTQKDFRRWKEAIHCVSRKHGLTSSNNRVQNKFVTVIVEEVKKVLNDVAEREVKIAEAKRNQVAARTEELIRILVRYLSLILLLAMVFGPYVIGVISVCSFLVGRFIINRAVESEW